jgi:hypothetical protein
MFDIFIAIHKKRAKLADFARLDGYLVVIIYPHAFYTYQQGYPLLMLKTKL